MSRPINQLAPALLVALALLGSVPSRAGEEARPQPVRIEQAHADYEAGRYPKAFAAFTRLADEGDAEAARMAVLMAKHGPWLYGEHFALSASQVWRWTTLIENTVVAKRP
jgi:hypothetical protein